MAIHFCYKGFCAIILLLCVDAGGVIVYVSSGRAVAMGDAFTWDTSGLLQGINGSIFLPQDAFVNILGRNVCPYIIAASAFASSQTVMKCFEGNTLTEEQKCFNLCVIRTRCVVENATMRLKAQ